MLIVYVMLFVLLTLPASDNAPLRDKKRACSELPLALLEDVLGGAFNPRYMSVDEPAEEAGGGGKRTAGPFAGDFYVEDGFSEALGETAAWDVGSHVAAARRRTAPARARRAAGYAQEWNCESTVAWMDLGPDYFPRYIRSVRCLSKNCWFGMYRCKPRSFTVKILRRRNGYCKEISAGRVVGSAGLPNDLKELWVWEERAVNFCCDCAK